MEVPWLQDAQYGRSMVVGLGASAGGSSKAAKVERWLKDAILASTDMLVLQTRSKIQDPTVEALKQHRCGHTNTYQMCRKWYDRRHRRFLQLFSTTSVKQMGSLHCTRVHNGTCELWIVVCAKHRAHPSPPLEP